ncbi:PREDICTED: probable 3-hydroxyisobutyrate dehydrogenase-like 2, mitochondrial [Prunus mume]|uniref:Probable 3-hydroxyisobutyrate dehydrogenase-like 2, mitochondrial n=1 Tax=Prunus mume TaxID=102107 RepID=A0ABM1LHN9_PRUMU|nr:PREDICTED: probable 3-hydroxyisobutyrate dehydrogenase-like 2, mitochondrial [Prunus mume]
MGTPYPNPISPSQTRIGWIGIGVMGAAMASRLLSAGYSLTIYARTPSKAHPLQSQGAQLADSPFQLAQLSDVVFTMVGHPPDVRSNILDPETGLLWGLRPNSVSVDMTSSHPALAREIFNAARTKDCWTVDAPESEEGRVAVLPGAALCKQLFSGMVANGDGKLGGQGLITVIERLNGK